MKYLAVFLVCRIVFIQGLYSQNEDVEIIQSIYNNALRDSFAYQNLRYLCYHTEGRITGSSKANEAVDYCYRRLKYLRPDTVYLQKVMVPNWNRGEKEIAYMRSKKFGELNLNICALGLSVGTGKGGVEGKILVVKSFEELKQLGENQVKGKIVFFNRAMDPTLINTFEAYGKAADQRVSGAAVAARFGAKAVIVRSLTGSIDSYPHTGVMKYDEGGVKIPAVAVSTRDAEIISEWYQKDKDLIIYFESHCELLPDVVSYNVIGEIRGKSKPEEIITVGGHLDAWDNGQGAHDDGAGCVQSMEVLRIFKELKIKPERTIRAVMFMDEEIAQRGGLEYAYQAMLSGEKHVFALESDRGGLSPLGFGFSGPEERVSKLIELEKYFIQYNLHIFKPGGGGVDISPLKKYNDSIVLSSYIPDWQRYFDYHHSGNDRFEKVNYRELQTGSSAITALIFLVDKYGL